MARHHHICFKLNSAIYSWHPSFHFPENQGWMSLKTDFWLVKDKNWQFICQWFTSWWWQWSCFMDLLIINVELKNAVSDPISVSSLFTEHVAYLLKFQLNWLMICLIIRPSKRPFSKQYTAVVFFSFWFSHFDTGYGRQKTCSKLRESTLNIQIKENNRSPKFLLLAPEKVYCQSLFFLKVG